MNFLKVQITSPRTDVVLLLVAGAIVMLLGADILHHGAHPKMGGIFVFIGAVNLLTAWRIWRRLPVDKDDSSATASE